MTAGFVPPIYPFDQLFPIEAVAKSLPGGMVDLSVGTPCDPPPQAVIDALSKSGQERGYPASLGSPRLLQASRDWMARRFGVELDRKLVANCLGTKEFVAGLPQWLKLRSPEKDTVLYPAIAYPTYEMGALLGELSSGSRRCTGGRIARSRGDNRRGRRAGALPMAEQPVEPDRRPRRSRRGRDLGARARCAGLLRRVLRRVHLGG